MIALERRRQTAVEGWTAEHDDLAHDADVLALAGGCYALANIDRENGMDDGRPPAAWPFSKAWWKPTPDDRKKELIKAGALIAAELDRIMRAEEATA